MGRARLPTTSPHAVGTVNNVAVVQLSPDYPIRTARLMLRPLTLADADALVSYRSIPEVCRYVPFEPMDHDTVTARIDGIWAQTAITEQGQAITFGIEREDTHELIGDVILFFHSETHRSGEIGWVLNPVHSGRGYATEAARAVLGLGFDVLGLRRVVARVDARNIASQRLCERLGMRREAHLVENEFFKGEWTDELDYALLNSEWQSQRPER
jgi:RimJ/RimL family protein N-acetyltransferase